MFSLFALFRLTGFQIPPPVTSTGSVFSLRLTSDFAVSAHGFKIYYEGKDSSPFCVVLHFVTLYCTYQTESAALIKSCSGYPAICANHNCIY